MLITADTLNQIMNLIVSNDEFEEPLRLYFSRRNDRDEFRQELHLAICQMQLDKLTDLWNNGQFKWFYLSIIKNQVMSNSSKWHRNFRKKRQKEISFEDITNFNTENIKEELNLQDSEEFYEYTDNLNKKKIQLINKIISEQITSNPKLLVHFTVFRMHFFENLSYKEISKKINITHTNIFNYNNRAKKILAEEFKRKLNTILPND